MQFIFKWLFSYFESSRIRYMKKELGFQERIIDLGGHSVFFLEKIGNPNLPTLVFIHGFLDGCYGFRKLVKHLDYEGSILVPDLPGYGRSTLPLISYLYQIDIIGNILYKAVRQLPHTQLILIGHSMGGLIAQKITLQNQKELKEQKKYNNLFQVNGLVLLGSGSIPHPKREEMRRILFPKNEKDIINLLNHLYFADVPEPSWLEKRILISGWDVKKNIYLAENTVMREKEIFFGNKAKNIKIPTLIIIGEEDQLTTVSMMKNLNSWIKKSKLVILKHARHAIHMEKAEFVTIEIKKFLKL
jgi:pimeloyl-ACP methyl ester carboxylesterase